MNGECDCEGKAIPKNEPDDKFIKVWEIEVPCQEYDYYLVRDYHDAVERVKDFAEAMMDAIPSDGSSYSITVRLQEVSVADYRGAAKG